MGNVAPLGLVAAIRVRGVDPNNNRARPTCLQQNRCWRPHHCRNTEHRFKQVFTCECPVTNQLETKGNEMRRTMISMLLVLAGSASACGTNESPPEPPSASTSAAVSSQELVSTDVNLKRIAPEGLAELVDLSKSRRATPEETRKLDAMRQRIRAGMEVK